MPRHRSARNGDPEHRLVGVETVYPLRIVAVADRYVRVGQTAETIFNPGISMRPLPVGSATTPASCGVPQLGAGAASSAARTRGSPVSMSTILVRLDTPETRRTALRRTPNASATAASAASVALPSSALALTRTTRAPACSPPTPGRAEAGLTRMAIRMQPVSRSALAQSAALQARTPLDGPPERYPPICVLCDRSAAISQDAQIRFIWLNDQRPEGCMRKIRVHIAVSVCGRLCFPNHGVAASSSLPDS